MALGLGVLGTACGSSSAVAPPTRSATASATPGGPCASVHVTTPIEDVPPACAALWAPYQVTKVPPPDILQQEHVPPAPPVRNMTNGAVSDADAQRWADASNRDSGWYKWAEANGQIGLLRHLVGDALIPADEQSALAADATIELPNCDLYPSDNALFEVGASDEGFFREKGLPTDSSFVVVGDYPGPCTESFHYPDGRVTSVQVSSQPTRVFIAGRLVSAAPLGDIWLGDASGNCADPTGPPAAWCGR